jgi:hypothetical protein
VCSWATTVSGWKGEAPSTRTACSWESTRQRIGLSVCLRSSSSHSAATTGVAGASKQTRKPSPSIAPMLGSPPDADL